MAGCQPTNTGVGGLWFMHYQKKFIKSYSQEAESWGHHAPQMQLFYTAQCSVEYQHISYVGLAACCGKFCISSFIHCKSCCQCPDFPGGRSGQGG